MRGGGRKVCRGHTHSHPLTPKHSSSCTTFTTDTTTTLQQDRPAHSDKCAYQYIGSYNSKPLPVASSTAGHTVETSVPETGSVSVSHLSKTSSGDTGHLLLSSLCRTCQGSKEKQDTLNVHIHTPALASLWYVQLSL